MERFSGSNLKITYSDDNKGESKKKAIEILQAWRTTTGVAIPKGVEVDVIHLATSSRSEFEASINDCNREILVGILGSHLIVEEGAKTGSRSAGETHDESLNDWADYLELTLREAIRLQVFTPLARLNFANANPPHLRFPGRGKDLKLTAEVDTLLNDMGVEFHEDHFYDTYGRRRPEEVTKPNLQN
jgi:phage gp29-like protein